MIIPVIVAVLLILAAGGFLYTQPQIRDQIAQNTGLPIGTSSIPAPSNVPSIGNPSLNIDTSNPYTIPHQAKNVFEDFVNTILSKIQVPQNNQLQMTQQQADSLKTDSKGILFTGIDFLSYVKHFAGDILGFLSQKAFGTDVPVWLIPLAAIIFTFMIAHKIIKHTIGIILLLIIVGLLVVGGLAYLHVGS